MSKEILKFILNQGEKAINQMSKPRKETEKTPEPKHLRKTSEVKQPK